MPSREGSLQFVDGPVDFGEVETRKAPTSDLGERTESVLHEVGLDDAGIRWLHEAGVISAATEE